MNRTVIALSSALVLAGSASGALVITEVLAQTSAGTASTINGDWWELTNTGGASINLAGYQWADTEDALGGATPQTNFFPAITIGAGESIVIVEEAVSSEAAWRSNWGASAALQILSTDEMLPSPGVSDTFSGLGSSNDGVFFYDPSGVLLSSFLYTTTTRGVSFENARDGSSLGLSVVGENGAVRGANNDVASPGTSVPAPAMLPVVAVGVFVSRRRAR